jgi:hypothetical protein
MSRRWVIVLVLLSIAILCAEIAVRLMVPATARIEIINESGEVIEDLVVIYRNTKVPIGNVGVDAHASAWVTADKSGTVKLDYHQKTNGMNGIEVGDFDLSNEVHDGSKLVVVIRQNQVGRYMEDDPDRWTWARVGDRLKEWMGIEKIPGFY